MRDETRGAWGWFSLVSLLAACSGGESPSLTTDIGSTATTSGLEDGPLWVTPLHEAVAANVGGGVGDTPFVAWIGTGAVSTARVDLATGELHEVVQVNGSVESTDPWSTVSVPLRCRPDFVC